MAARSGAKAKRFFEEEVPHGRGLFTIHGTDFPSMASPLGYDGIPLRVEHRGAEWGETGGRGVLSLRDISS